MGMAILYKLVKSHEAILHLQTAPDEGTSVTIFFKEHPTACTESQIKDSGPRTRGNGQRILLVDDEVDLLNSVSQLLTETGYRVQPYSDPIEALEHFKRTPEEFDIAVTDESMPKISGIQLMKELKSLKPEFPVIICTGYSEELDRQGLEAIDSYDLIRKPFTVEEISKSIDAALQ